MLEDQQYRCAMTGWPLEPGTASLDHIQPLSAGGEHEIGNVQIVHKSVNFAKGTMAMDEFIAMCKAVASNAN